MKTTCLFGLAFVLFHLPNSSAAQSHPFSSNRFESNFSGTKKPKDKGDDPTDNNSGGGNSHPANVPFDGGLALLLATGAAYGTKQFRKKAILPLAD